MGDAQLGRGLARSDRPRVLPVVRVACLDVLAGDCAYPAPTPVQQLPPTPVTHRLCYPPPVLPTACVTHRLCRRRRHLQDAGRGRGAAGVRGPPADGGPAQAPHRRRGAQAPLAAAGVPLARQHVGGRRTVAASGASAGAGAALRGAAAAGPAERRPAAEAGMGPAAVSGSKRKPARLDNNCFVGGWVMRASRVDFSIWGSGVEGLQAGCFGEDWAVIGAHTYCLCSHRRLSGSGGRSYCMA